MKCHWWSSCEMSESTLTYAHHASLYPPFRGTLLKLSEVCMKIKRYGIILLTCLLINFLLHHGSMLLGYLAMQNYAETNLRQCFEAVMCSGRFMVLHFLGLLVCGRSGCLSLTSQSTLTLASVSVGRYVVTLFLFLARLVPS